MKTKADRAQRVKWLVKHPELWQAHEFPDHMRKLVAADWVVVKEIVKQMKRAGLIARTTAPLDVNMVVLVRQARLRLRWDS